MSLEARMRQVLLELSMTSNGRTTSWDASGGGTVDHYLVDDRGRGKLTPGDAPQLRYAMRWEHARDDVDRQALIDEAQQELEQITRSRATPPTEWETAEQLAKRIVRDGAGFSKREVAIAMRTSEKSVAAARTAAGVDEDLGHPIAAIDAKQLPIDRRRHRVLELDARGVSISGIARALGVSRSTVRRYLGRKA